ncbi:NgoPII family restriction endonuclease [Gaetbulibacter sp. 5U11]|nr:NgoPII family restriction endonuclease [Gaetbulibacter sp. 5U11]
MIKGGDAIEVKKTQSANSSLALNSSYPKTDLRHTSPMITSECRDCEEWTVKDLIYCVGHTSDTNIKSLWMVYGSSYAAKHETYQRIKTTISDGIKTIPDVVFADTKELGRVNQVDPLGITNLRIRGMWQIENPRKVFNYLHEPTDKDFELVCIIPLEKYNSFPNESKSKLEGITEKGFSIEDKQIKNPNNPAKLMDCKLIKLCV